MEEPYLEVELPPPSSPKKREQKEKEEPEPILETTAVAPAPLLRIELPERVPETPTLPPPSHDGFYYVDVVIEEVGRSGLKRYPVFPAVVSSFFAPRMAVAMLRVAAVAARFYAPLSQLPAPGMPARPPESRKLGAVIFGYRGTISCAILTTLHPAPALHVIGAVRGPDAWWGFEEEKDEWENSWVNGLPPEELPQAWSAEIDREVTEALRRARQPPLTWLLELKEEVDVKAVERLVYDEKKKRYHIPSYFIRI